MTEIQEKVFRAFCELSCYCIASDVFSTRTIARKTGLTIYKTSKTIHELREMGLLSNDTYVHYVTVNEYYEPDGDPVPPIRGFSLTEKGRNSEIFKKEKEAHFEWIDNNMLR